MTRIDFNDNTVESRYTYRHNPVSDYSFLILKREDDETDFAQIGEYTVLDMEEDRNLSERKVMNLVSALNGRQKLMELGEETGKRILFHPIPRTNETEKSKIIFHELKEDIGVSKENAILTIMEDLEDDN